MTQKIKQEAIDPSVTFPVGGNFKNRIINGDMRIDQRNSGGSVSLSSPNSGYLVDRWFFNSNLVAGALSFQRVADGPAGFTNSTKITVVATAIAGSLQFINFSQFIEGFNTQDLAWGTASAVPAALSFWVKASVPGTYSVSLQNSFPDRSIVQNFTVTTGWTKVTIIVPGDTGGTWFTNQNIGVRVNFDLGSSTADSGTATLGSWISGGMALKGITATSLIAQANGSTLNITGVQLEVASSASTFDNRPYGAELALCQRYYERVGSTGGFSLFASGYCHTTTSFRAALPYLVTKRVLPTITPGPVAQFNVATTSGNNAVSAISTGATGTQGGWLTVTSTGLTAGQGGLLVDANSSLAYLEVSAEL